MLFLPARIVFMIVNEEKKKYKVLMLDIDGTLIKLEHNAKPSIRVLEAIKQAQQKLHVGIVTGRPLFFLQDFFNLVKLESPCIINGGAQIIDPLTKSVLWEQCIDKKDLRSIADMLPKQLENTVIVDTANNEYPFSSYLEINKPLKAVIIDITIEEANIISKQLNRISNLAIHKASSQIKGKLNIDITHVNATKQYGIEKVSEILNIRTHDFIAVGDHYNDFPLLMACGLKIAMGNAVEDLKAIADYIAPSVEEDGVVDVIEKYVL